MADQKISQLPTSSNPISTSVIPIVEGGANKKATLDSLPVQSAVTTALSLKEDAGNKEMSVTTSTTKYPTSSAVKTYVDNTSLINALIFG